MNLGNGKSITQKKKPSVLNFQKISKKVLNHENAASNILNAANKTDKSNGNGNHRKDAVF